MTITVYNTHLISHLFQPKADQPLADTTAV